MKLGMGTGLGDLGIKLGLKDKVDTGLRQSSWYVSGGCDYWAFLSHLYLGMKIMGRFGFFWRMAV